MCERKMGSWKRNLNKKIEKKKKESEMRKKEKKEKKTLGKVNYRRTGNTEHTQINGNCQTKKNKIRN